MRINRGTEMKVEAFTNYNVSFGAMNKNNPKSLYIKISCWGNPILEDENNYKSVIKKINKRVRTNLYLNTNREKFRVDKTMVDLDMRESGINFGKSSYMSCEITLFQNNEHLLKSDIMLSELNEITKNVINEVLDENEYFNFFKKKNEAKMKLKKA